MDSGIDPHPARLCRCRRDGMPCGTPGLSAVGT